MRTKEGNKEKDILEAAVKVFATNGYHRAKISKIAEIAGVATGSVYVYFSNKEALLLKIFEQLWEKLYDELKIVSETQNMSPLERIDAMIDLVFDVFTENPSLAIVFVNEQNHLIRTSHDSFTTYYDKFLDLGVEVIKEGIKKGLIYSSIDLIVFRHYLLGGIRNLLQHWANDPQELTINKIRQSVKLLTKHGIQK